MTKTMALCAAIVAAVLLRPSLATADSWSNQDVGSVGAAGSSMQTTSSDGTVTATVKGSGADIWGTLDEFQFDYQSLTGNGTITARVVSETPTDPWAKAGVMIRETLSPSSTHALVAVTPSFGVAFQRRKTTGGQSVHTYGPLVAAPYWVRLTRTGNTFSAYSSPNGTTWSLVGTDTISMAATVFVGLAVTSHHDGALNTAMFDHVAPPACNPLDFGAAGDGVTDDTAAIQRAVDACATQGGGTVELSASSKSKYLTGPLQLKSHVHLQVDQDIVLLGTNDHSRYAGAEINWTYLPNEALISAAGTDVAICTDVAIVGAGTIDGQGASWWTPVAPHRPYLLEFYRCDHVTISGVTLKDAPAWFQALRFSQDITESAVTVTAPTNSPNTDGVDVVGSTRVNLSGLHISVGDDDIAIKSGKAFDPMDTSGRQQGLPQMAASWIQISDITATGGRGIVIGSEAVNGVNNVSIQNVSMSNTRWGFYIRSGRDRGGDIHDITVDAGADRGFTMSGVGGPIILSDYYKDPDSPNGVDAPVEPPYKPAKTVTSTTPYVHDITIQNLTATGATRTSIIEGLPEACFHNVTLTDVKIQTVNQPQYLGMVLRHMTGTFTNVTSIPGAPPPFVVQENVTVASAGTTPPIAVTAPQTGQIACSAQVAVPPGGWSNQDVGSVGAAGSSTQTTSSDGTITATVKGSGADIWGTLDEFQFDYHSLTGDGTITARVVSETPTDPWAKAGVMIRETLSPSSTHALVAVTPSFGVAFQRRKTTGGQSVHTYGPLVAAPYWVRLTRTGNTFSAYSSPNGTTWTLVGTDTISMAATVFAGLAVTSHHDGVLNTATFDHVAVAPAAPPSGWSNQDVGSVGAAGSSTQTTSSDGTVTFTVKGSGADIWGAVDEFQFNYHSLTGDGTITARVVSETPTDPWAKAGVMIRETLSPSSTHALVAVTPSFGVAFQRRTATGGQTAHTYGPLTVAPYWVRLTRKGNTFSAYASADGTTWTLVGQATISMAATVFVGLAVTSHHDGSINTATFDHVVGPSSHIMGVRFDWISYLTKAQGSDNWPTTWSNDDNQYSMWGDGGGFGGSDSDGRSSFGVARIVGDNTNYQGFNRYGGKGGECPSTIDGKSHGAPLSLGGVLYTWVTPLNGVSGYESFTLYKSTDKACHWTPLSVTFARTTDGIIFGGFVQFGKDNGAAIDPYVYIVATKVVSDISSLDRVQKPGRVMLLRVPAASIENRPAYEFFAGLVNGQPTWSSAASQASAVYEDDDGVGPFPQMSYVPGLGRFVYTNQHGNGSDALGSQSLLTMAEAPRPWGPWTDFYRAVFSSDLDSSKPARTLFQWNFAPKWFRQGDSNFTLIFTGTGTNDSWNTVDGAFIVSP